LRYSRIAAQKQLFLRRLRVHFWAGKLSTISGGQEIGILGRARVFGATG
jgi:hypothetical protein